MKSLYNYISAAAVLFLLAACNKDNLEGNVVFQASIDAPDTKLALSVDGGLYKNYWTSGEKVLIFDENDEQCQFAVTPISTGATATLKGTGTFGGTTYSKNTETGGITFLKTIYAVHPYNKNIELSSSGILTFPVNLGMKQNQIGVKDGFPVDPNAGTTVLSGVKVAKSRNGFFKFVNVSSYIKFTLTENNIVRVTFNTCDNAYPPFIGGAPLILDYTGDTPTISYDSATTKWGSVTLCKNTTYSDPLEPGTYYLNIMPTNFNVLRTEGGGSYFKMSLFTSDNTAKAAKNIYATKPVNVTPGMVLDLGTLTTAGVVSE